MNILTNVFTGSDNLIADGFYDSGRLRRENPVKTLANHNEDDNRLFEHIDADRVLRCKKTWLAVI